MEANVSALFLLFLELESHQSIRISIEKTFMCIGIYKMNIKNSSQELHPCMQPPHEDLKVAMILITEMYIIEVVVGCIECNYTAPYIFYCSMLLHNYSLEPGVIPSIRLIKTN